MHARPWQPASINQDSLYMWLVYLEVALALLQKELFKTSQAASAAASVTKSRLVVETRQ